MRMIWEPDFKPVLDLPEWEEVAHRLRVLPESITPFREILRVNRGGPWLKFVLLGNIAMFAPIGFGLGLLWKEKRWYHAVLFGAAFSFGIEFIQVFVGRVSDIDDVMLNTVGTLFGFIIYCIVSKVISLDWHKFCCQIKEDI